MLMPTVRKSRVFYMGNECMNTIFACILVKSFLDSHSILGYIKKIMSQLGFDPKPFQDNIIDEKYRFFIESLHYVIPQFPL